MLASPDPQLRDRARWGLIEAQRRIGDWAEARKWAIEAAGECSAPDEQARARLWSGVFSARLGLPQQALEDLSPLLAEGSEQAQDIKAEDGLSFTLPEVGKYTAVVVG